MFPSQKLITLSSLLQKETSKFSHLSYWDLRLFGISSKNDQNQRSKLPFDFLSNVASIKHYTSTIQDFHKMVDNKNNAPYIKYASLHTADFCSAKKLSPPWKKTSIQNWFSCHVLQIQSITATLDLSTELLFLFFQPISWFHFTWTAGTDLKHTDVDSKSFWKHYANWKLSFFCCYNINSGVDFG